ncbi:uncharacterized protein [Rhodnius prolixus]|uniref:uncharacterized protein n=1 Tax=Rhodnius prolixus TaxID=13249 RepID=UPI003D1883F6
MMVSKYVVLIFIQLLDIFAEEKCISNCKELILKEETSNCRNKLLYRLQKCLANADKYALKSCYENCNIYKKFIYSSNNAKGEKCMGNCSKLAYAKQIGDCRKRWLPLFPICIVSANKNVIKRIDELCNHLDERKINISNVPCCYNTVHCDSQAMKTVAIDSHNHRAQSHQFNNISKKMNSSSVFNVYPLTKKIENLQKYGYNKDFNQNNAFNVWIQKLILSNMQKQNFAVRSPHNIRRNNPNITSSLQPTNDRIDNNIFGDKQTLSAPRKKHSKSNLLFFLQHKYVNEKYTQPVDELKFSHKVILDKTPKTKNTTRAVANNLSQESNMHQQKNDYFHQNMESSLAFFTNGRAKHNKNFTKDAQQFLDAIYSSNNVPKLTYHNTYHFPTDSFLRRDQSNSKQPENELSPPSANPDNNFFPHSLNIYSESYLNSPGRYKRNNYPAEVTGSATNNNEYPAEMKYPPGLLNNYPDGPRGYPDRYYYDYPTPSPADGKNYNQYPAESKPGEQNPSSYINNYPDGPRGYPDSYNYDYPTPGPADGKNDNQYPAESKPGEQNPSSYINNYPDGPRGYPDSYNYDYPTPGPADGKNDNQYPAEFKPGEQNPPSSINNYPDGPRGYPDRNHNNYPTPGPADGKNNSQYLPESNHVTVTKATNYPSHKTVRPSKRKTNTRCPQTKFSSNMAPGTPRTSDRICYKRHRSTMKQFRKMWEDDDQWNSNDDSMNVIVADIPLWNSESDESDSLF